MHISLASILTVAAFAGAVSARPEHHKKHHHKSHHAPKGKAFDRVIQIWFENQVCSALNSPKKKSENAHN